MNPPGLRFHGFPQASKRIPPHAAFPGAGGGLRVVWGRPNWAHHLDCWFGSLDLNCLVEIKLGFPFNPQKVKHFLQGSQQQPSHLFFLFGLMYFKPDRSRADGYQAICEPTLRTSKAESSSTRWKYSPSQSASSLIKKKSMGQPSQVVLQWEKGYAPSRKTENNTDILHLEIQLSKKS